MVKKVMRAKKSTAKKTYARKNPFGGKYKQKPRVFKRKATPMRRVTKSSLKHVIISAAQIPSDYRSAQGNNPMVIDPRTVVMQNLINNSNRYYNLDMDGGYIVPLGVSDGVQSLAISIQQAISDKHTRIVKSIGNTNQTYLSKRPLIEYTGISLYAHQGMQPLNNKGYYYPMCYYQPHEGVPLTPIIFQSKKLYIKLPKQVQGTNVTRAWPLHLSFFNVNNCTIKIYYKVLTKQGVTNEGEDGAMNIQLDRELNAEY